jgi:adenylate kinase family enzyme
MTSRPLLSLGQRICVVGTSGSGKTYVAQALAECLGLRYVSNDALIWGPNWHEVPREERLATFDAATRDGGWTFDGNLGPSPEDELVLSRCDTLVWLDLPRCQVMAAITWRTLWRAATRQRLFHDNVERWSMAFSSDSMIMWSWRTYAPRKSQYARLFTDPAQAERARIRLASRGEVNRWLASLQRWSEA